MPLINDAEWFDIHAVPDFSAREDASHWLKNVWLQRSDLIHRVRDCLSRHGGDEKIFLLSDHEAIERMAVLLHSRWITAPPRQKRDDRGSGGGMLPPPGVEPEPLPSGSKLAASQADDSQTVAPLWIRLDLTQKQAEKETGSLRLAGSKGYDKTLAIAGNFVPNAVEANTVDVLFEDVPTGATYCLTYIGDDGPAVTIVQGAPFDTLRDESVES